MMTHNLPAQADRSQITKLGTDFLNIRILVIGDIMLDRYISGEVHRISPEAPVPVLSVSNERATAGGGGNVALNLAGLGAQTFVAGIVGTDSNGSTLTKLLQDHGIGTTGILTDPTRPTTCKTRVICGSHQLVRIDHEQTVDISAEATQVLQDRLVNLLQLKPHGVILSDYAKGVLTAPLIRFIISECNQRCIPTFVDPKKDDYQIYARATCLTPNLKEFHSAARAMSIPIADLPLAGSLIREQIGASMLLITQGADGMSLVSQDGVRHFPALAEEVFDVSGAGDTVVATYALAISAGLSPLQALELSNVAASIVVRKIGTAPILWSELLHSLSLCRAQDQLVSGLHSAQSSGATLAVS